MTKIEYYELLQTSVQNETLPSIHKGLCCYRLGEKKCVIGLLIPDEKYDPKLEGIGLKYLQDKAIVNIPDGMSFAELCAIQLLHDTSAPKWKPKRFLNALEELFGYD